MPRSTFIALLFLSLGFSPTSVLPAASVPQAGPVLRVVSGYGGPNVVVEEFLPSRIRVVEGTTVVWTQGSLRGHTVSFPGGMPAPLEAFPQPEDPSLPRMRNPQVEFRVVPNGPYDGTYFIGSGVMDEGETFPVTFARSGAYPFRCLLRGHEGMTGTVEVVPPGTDGITTQQQVDQFIREASARFDEETEQLWTTRSEAGRLENPDGTISWFVRNGTDYREQDGSIHVTLRAYLPSRLTVNAGDTVVWHSDTRVPVHTVTFLPQNSPPISRWTPRLEDGSLVPLDMLTITGRYRGRPDSLDWPRILEDPELTRTIRPRPIYDPSQFYSSGEMGDGDRPTVGRAWSLTFQTPGTFSYFCIPHVEIGQIGQITVLPSAPS
jgi:plastocyanin